MSYAWKEGSRIEISPAKAGKAIVALKARDGLIDPADVVAEARKRKSPLHSYFEWDDAVASEKYRLAQAQHLIRCLVIRKKGEEVARQTFYALRGPRATAYVHRAAVLRDKQLAADLLAQARRDMSRFMARYEEIKGDLEDVFGAMEDFLDEAA